MKTLISYVGLERDRVLISSMKLLLVALAICVSALGQMPAGVHWVDFKRESATVQKIQRALDAEDYTAIREVILADEFALVTAVRRETWQNTPAEDQWLVYSVSMKNGTARRLLSGYNLQIKSWLGFYSHDKRDLGITYLDCDECEPATLFTALHCRPRDGWRPRWKNEKDPNHPGITFLITDVGDPYTNEDVDQVSAVLAPENSAASVGTWYHSQDLATGKVTDEVVSFTVDQSTGEDRSTVLTGVKAKDLKLQLCKAKDSRSGLAMGQSSRACKQLLNAKPKTAK